MGGLAGEREDAGLGMNPGKLGNDLGLKEIDKCGRWIAYMATANGTQMARGEENGWCIARQPILTAEEAVVGYELLIRQSAEERSRPGNETAGIFSSIDAINLVGLEVVCDGKLAFIHATRETLLGDYFTLLPPDEIVIQLQETVAADLEVRQACKELKRKGYRLALDNFVEGDGREELVALCDFLKVDIARVPAEECTALVGRHGAEHRRMVANKVDSRQLSMVAKKCGFTRFQGYFYQEPENVQNRQIPANQASYVRLLCAVSKPEVEYAEIENLIKHEPALTYRLLRYVNSPLLGISNPIHSVRMAFSMLGERESIRWIRMATTMAVGAGKASDLVLASLVRARFCELIAPRVEHGDCDLFLMGMLSLIDAMLAMPMGVAIGELALDPTVKAQLMGAKTGKKTVLSPIYDLMMARETGDWEEATRLCRELKLSLAFVAECSNQAMKWAHEVSGTGE